MKTCMKQAKLPSVTSVRARSSLRVSAFKLQDVPSVAGNFAKRAAVNLASVGLTLSLLAGPVAADTESVVRLPASTNPAVFAVQRTMVEAWTIIGESFVDENFNGRNWAEELRQHMVAAYTSDQPDVAYDELNSMLAELDDPYTRRVPPEEYQQFMVTSEGELQGVGLLIANEPVNGHLLVLAPIKGGPAERAGVLPGDEVVSINGRPTEGLDGESAARALRGQGGTEVRVKLVRRSEGIPGVPGRPEPLPEVQYKEFKLRREKVTLNPLYYTYMEHDGQKTGYIRLMTFSNNASEEMEKAVKHLEKLGCDSYILDLRNNPGGLVRSSIDVARIWLDGNPVVFNITAREGEVAEQRVEVKESSKALTHDPMVVLVNGGSASASEILAGALKDNNRATIIGDEDTFGKGRIQSVFELQDGSALFVTVAKYETPMGKEIDHRGIHPDSACAPEPRPSYQPLGLAAAAASDQRLREELSLDGCVLMAENVIHKNAEMVAATKAVVASLGF